MAVTKYEYLSQDQIDHFMTFGWVTISQCFTKEEAEKWTKDLWKRLGYEENSPSTWMLEKINMPVLNYLDVLDLAPKAWGAICELCGGEDRVTEDSRLWGDNFIVNFGKASLKGKTKGPLELDNWHVDGDNFIHFLDSPNQALLVIPCITDVLGHGGATYICPESIGVVARHLHDHPEGVTPYMAVPGQESKWHEFQWYCEKVRDSEKCTTFQQVTGKCGDVVLMHPLMVHSASRNALHIPRIITNPPVSLKEPFKFHREDPREYSLVEKKTLKELGVDSLPDWKITGSRKALLPGREAIHARMREREIKRLAGEAIGPELDTGVEVHREIVPESIIGGAILETEST